MLLGHVVLLGDSVFDDAAYVAEASDVVRQVRRRLPLGVRATLAAVDGSKMGDVYQQLGDSPAERQPSAPPRVQGASPPVR